MNEGHKEKRRRGSGGASSEKSEGNGGDFDVIFNPKVYLTNFMPFFFDNFCRLLRLGGGGQVPPVGER